MSDDNDLSAPQQIYDVLIVGAGPVGLATAIALLKRGITNILVIDQTREFRRVGQVVDLLPNGLRAIKYIDPTAYEQIKASPSGVNKPSSSSVSQPQPAPEKQRWCQRNLQGEILRSFPTDFQSWFDHYGEERVSLPWFNLQTELRNILPPEKVLAKHRCVFIEDGPDWVRVDSTSDAAESINPFAHWEMLRSDPQRSTSPETSQTSVSGRFYAKLVVAADGINSTMRQVLYENKGLEEWAKPQYSGFAAMGCFQFENLPKSILDNLETYYLQGARIVTVKNDSSQFDSPEQEQTRIVLVRLSETAIGYAITSPINLDVLQKSSPEEILDLGLTSLRDAEFLPIFSEFVGLSAPEKVFHRPYFIHPIASLKNVQSIWSHGRAVLVGDAAHGMPPFMAQGANQGLEDAAVVGTYMAQLIQDDGLDDMTAIENAFHQYEQIRRPLMEKVQSATMTCNQWSQPQCDQFKEILHRREYPSSVTLGELG
ncbi:FAD-dependent monooxygenase [Acaryochloris sp. 'Moss Beach']|uniref:FAD-dependent oxidoreductase n=1 Tax=Acaryochloris sp. 'Moss Beach' TaxID=2740837 RepID=UPI001F1F5787|nr:NAD(P)/FAD-dependent oxidoreductase [Acaryochloris sp. 'Moss Beach']UJB69523.1 FAD-dependent monooxygenase [Acaryochloris sp. 'Moss Beach']